MFTSRQDLVLLGLAGALIFCASSFARAEPPAGANRTCFHNNTNCKNNCRNGMTLPIGSSEQAIDQCDGACLKKYDRCNDAFRRNDSVHRADPRTHVPVRNTGGGVLHPPSNSQPNVHTSGSGAARHK